MAKKKEPMVKFQMRWPKSDLARVRARASVYAGGNLSKFLRYAGVEVDGRFLVEKKPGKK